MTKEELLNQADILDMEADACEENGSNFSASEYREEAERLRKLSNNK